MTAFHTSRGNRFLLSVATILFCCFASASAQEHDTTNSIPGEHTSDERSGDVHHDVHHLTPAQEMNEILNHKVENTRYIHEYPFPKISLPQDWKLNIAGLQLDFSPSRHLVYLWLSFGVTIVLVWFAARQNNRNTIPRGFGNMIEAMVVFVRDEMAIPFLGKDAQRYLMLLLTYFFFIAITNLIGLLPFGATATGNINVTAALALITLIVMIGSGMKANGIWGYMKGLVPHGMPAPLYVILVPIEIMGLFTKPFALSIRLFANMLSGALVIGAFYALIFGMDTLLIAPMSIAFLLFMSLLKIFVCFLQAYIFTMLSSFFIGMSIHQEH